MLISHQISVGKVLVILKPGLVVTFYSSEVDFFEGQFLCRHIRYIMDKIVWLF